MAFHAPDPDDPGAPVHRAAEGPPPSPNDVRRTLEGVIDPELRASIVELGMVRDVRVADDGEVTVKVALTTAGCPLRAQIQSDVESKVRALRGVTDVRVEYGEMTQDEKSAVMQRARWQARENAPGTEVLPTTRVLAVASGKGGVGKSSVTVNLAGALEQFLTDVRWGEMDYLLIDMPPGTGDIQMALARLLPSTELLVVTTPALAAQQVATRVADMARRSFLKVIGVIENMSTFAAPDGSRHAIFGEGGGAALANEIDVPLLGAVPIEPGVSAGGDAGKPVAMTAPDSAAGAEFHRIAGQIVDELLPPLDLSSCTARIFDLAQANLDAKDAAAR